MRKSRPSRFVSAAGIMAMIMAVLAVCPCPAVAAPPAATGHECCAGQTRLTAAPGPSCCSTDDQVTGVTLTAGSAAFVHAAALRSAAVQLPAPVLPMGLRPAVLRTPPPILRV